MVVLPLNSRESSSMINPAIVERVDAELDARVSQKYKDQPLAQHWARVSKVVEECGEAINELIVLTGQNPRKPADPDAITRLLEELADTAMTPIYAIQHFTKDIEMTKAILDKIQRKHYYRLTGETIDGLQREGCNQLWDALKIAANLKPPPLCWQRYHHGAQ